MATEQTDSGLPKTEKEWRKVLSKDEYKILRRKGTEPRFSGDYVDMKDDGTYVCAGCGAELFSSETKYESGTGWPSFYAAIEERIETKPDRGLIRERTEILCKRCGGHLGHVFDDGPEPTGKRYCVNSIALDFKPED